MDAKSFIEEKERMCKLVEVAYCALHGWTMGALFHQEVGLLLNNKSIWLKNGQSNTRVKHDSRCFWNSILTQRLIVMAYFIYAHQLFMELS